MRKIFSLLMLGYVSLTFAQREANYSNFMYNMGYFNPGYMLDDPDLIQAGLIRRQQWVGIAGAPETTQIFASLPITYTTEIKLNIVHDKVGDFYQDYNAQANFAKSIDLDRNTKLALGISGGLQYSTFDFANGKVTSNTLGANDSEIRANAGAGLFLFTDRFYLGASIPRLFNTNTTTPEVDDLATAYLTLGYVYNLTKQIKFKPAAVASYINGGDFGVFIGANIMLYDMVEVGGLYKYEDSFSGLISFNTYKNLKIGYSYDYGFSNLSKQSSGSHELILIYTFDTLSRNKKYSSPRFF